MRIVAEYAPKASLILSATGIIISTRATTPFVSR
jgi:hypothetical protein